MFFCTCRVLEKNRVRNIKNNFDLKIYVYITITNIHTCQNGIC